MTDAMRDPGVHAPAPAARGVIVDAATVSFLLLLHLGLLLDGARRDSVTFDETDFIAGGVSAWQTGDFRLSPEAGALGLRLEGLLPWLAGHRLALDEPAWHGSNAWTLGRGLVYAPGTDPARLLFLARLPVALVATALAGIVYAITRRLFGRAAALVALTLHALSPPFLAHGHLATADLLVAATFLAAAWLAARCLARATPASVAASCLATAACFLAKFSAVLLVPIVALVVIARLLAGAPVAVGRRARPVRSLRGRLLVVALLVVAHATVTIALIWLAFGLRYPAFRHDAAGGSLKEGGWAGVEGAGAIEPIVAFARRHELLPEAWLFGLQFTAHRAHGRNAFALERYSATGWPWFFPFAMAVKTPLATLALLALGVAAFPSAWRRGRVTLAPRARDDLDVPARGAWRDDVVALSPILALLVVYWAVALATPLNIGFRHLLPTLPATFVIAGAAITLARTQATRRLIACLVVLAALEGLAAHPFQIAYMNPLGGLPENRWRRLVDSSLDWGQDARRVAAWLDADARTRGGDAAYLAWFGLSDPEREGTSQPVHRLDGRGRTTMPARLRGGTYVVSATMLAQVYGDFPGTWARPFEDEWRRVDAIVQERLGGGGASSDPMDAGSDHESWTGIVDLHQQLRLARLCAWLRQRRPDAVIGAGAVLAWHLDDDEVEEAIHGPPAELVPTPVMK